MTINSNQYRELFNSCRLTNDEKCLKILDKVCATVLLHQEKYQTVQKFVSIPWPLIAAIHFRESNQSFDRHLHNGDPLTGRTIHVPKGRPVHGNPPFIWVESAIDALSKDIWIPKIWDVPGSLEFMERFNGLGYQRRGVLTPYLWNYTDKYTKGLYVSDGKFDSEKVERRPGCVAILKTLAKSGESFDFTGMLAINNPMH